MSDVQANIAVPVDLTNPGQFFACCGLLETASRIDEGAGGWFDNQHFFLNACYSLEEIVAVVASSTIENTMLPSQRARLKELSAMTKKQRDGISGLEEEKEELESLRRELPIVIDGKVLMTIDWFCDTIAGGSRFKTWAGRQSVLNIAQAMHQGISKVRIDAGADLWQSVRRVGLPFNFDSDLGGQGSARDIGFSFDPLAGSEATRVEGTCKPLLELFCFIGLQRFRPRELKGENRFIYSAWSAPALVSIASAYACTAIPTGESKAFAFSLLYRTKYLKSFLPAQSFTGASNE
jgi:CRISPR-associated protein Csb3